MFLGHRRKHKETLGKTKKKQGIQGLDFLYSIILYMFLLYYGTVPRPPPVAPAALSTLRTLLSTQPAACLPHLDTVLEDHPVSPRPLFPENLGQEKALLTSNNLIPWINGKTSRWSHECLPRFSFPSHCKLMAIPITNPDLLFFSHCETNGNADYETRLNIYFSMIS